MRYYLANQALVLSALITGSVWAGEDAVGVARNQGGQSGRAEFRQKMLDEFDADGDGELNEDERATARKEMRGRRGRGGPEGRRRGRDSQGPPDP